MATLKILGYPAEELKKSCRKVGRADIARARELVRDMQDTMKSDNGVGLAANQVGELLRIIVVLDIETDEINYYVNPTIVDGRGEEMDEEGCLSFPGLCGLVARYEAISVKFQDLDLNTYRVELEGVAARVVQHEIDHLNGITIRDRSSVELYHRKDEDEEEENPKPRRRRRPVIN
jgi:peptide deformylase